MEPEVAAPPKSQTRIALVMNGGVSLAVWMGGVTHELDLMCRASVPGASEEDVAAKDRPVFRIWKHLAEEARTHLLVDIVAGSSAGGINGMLLATSLARGASLPDLQNLWARSAALDNLLKPQSETSLLSGKSFEKMVIDAVESIGSDAEPLRPQHVTLFTTATALDGRSRRYVDGFTNGFDVRDHRRLYRFQQQQVVTYIDDAGWQFSEKTAKDFTPENNSALVQAARATASFPGAFPPVNERPLMNHRMQPKRIFNYPASCVMDGGVLSNAPFQPVLEAITQRKLNTQVRRVLVHVVPSVGRLGEESTTNDRCDEIGWIQVLINGLRYPQEADFRSSAEDLCSRLSATARDSQLELFERASGDEALADLLRTTARSLLSEYRRNRARAVVFDTRLRLAAAETVTQLVTATETDLGYIERIINCLFPDQPNWVPKNDFDEITAPDFADWRWGLVPTERVLQCLGSDLHRRLNDDVPPARRDPLVQGSAFISERFERALAVSEAVDARLRLLRPSGSELSNETIAALIQCVFKELGSLVKEAGEAYVRALRDAELPGWRRPEDAVSACLAVEVVTRVYAPPSKIIAPLMPSLEFLRLGPDDIGQLFMEDRFANVGDRKLYGLRFQHFGAFVDEKWRRSDFAWGRLDAAHHLLGLFHFEEADDRRRCEKDLQAVILRAEAPGSGRRPADLGTAREWMEGNLEELKDEDHKLLRKVAESRTGRAVLGDLRRSVLDLVRLPPTASLLIRL